MSLRLEVSLFVLSPEIDEDRGRQLGEAQKDLLLLLIYTTGVFFFKFGVELSIVNALYRLRITDQLFKYYAFTRVVHSQSTLQRLLRRQIKKNTLYTILCSRGSQKKIVPELIFFLSLRLH
jgi:hypothetical protein